VNDDISYQNREIGDLNPLIPSETADITPPVKQPMNFKLKLLVTLGIFIVSLSVVGLVISLIKKSRSTPAAPAPLPDITQTQLPTGTPDSTIPTEFKDKFSQIDQYNKTDVNFNPPQIDPNIGQ
jgi:hypothetical protein